METLKAREALYGEQKKKGSVQTDGHACTQRDQMLVEGVVQHVCRKHWRRRGESGGVRGEGHMEGRGSGERACESGYFRACGLLWTSGKVPLVAHACSSSCGTVGSMRTSTYPGCKFLRACAAVAFWIGKQKGGKCLSCCASPSSVTLAHGEEDEKKHPRRRSLEGWANLGAFTAPVWRVWRMRPLDEGHAGGETDGSRIAKKWTAS